MADTHVVLTWAHAAEWRDGDADVRVPAAKGTAPAIRVWGDALIGLTSDARHPDIDPSPWLRAHALFAWPARTPPGADDVAGFRTCIALTVDPDRCAIARHDVIDRVFDPVEWRRLLASLGDDGIDMDTAKEEVVVFDAPLAPMLIAQGRGVVESANPVMRQRIEEYFASSVAAYLESWQPLSTWQSVALPSAATWEVLVPRDAVLQASVVS